jgi:Na+/alanine symporter
MVVAWRQWEIVTMAQFEQFVAAASEITLGPVTVALILGTGLYLTIGLRFF